jgi:hypothetical protein
MRETVQRASEREKERKKQRAINIYVCVNTRQANSYMTTPSAQMSLFWL